MKTPRGSSLSPREERAGRELERGQTDEKRPPLPRPSPPFLGRRGRRESLLRSKQTTCRTLLVGNPRYSRFGNLYSYSVVATLKTYPHRMRGEGGFSRVRGIPAHDVDRKYFWQPV